MYYLHIIQILYLVYELHITVPLLSTEKDTKLVRRYDKFEDYLTDLLEILKVKCSSIRNKRIYK